MTRPSRFLRRSCTAGRRGRAFYLSWLAEVSTIVVYLVRAVNGRGRHRQRRRSSTTIRRCRCSRTALAADRMTTLYVASRERFPGDERDIVVARSRDHGTTWSTPVRVHVDASGGRSSRCRPSVKVGRAALSTWPGGRAAGRAGARCARSRDGGAPSPPQSRLGSPSMRARRTSSSVWVGGWARTLVWSWPPG